MQLDTVTAIFIPESVCLSESVFLIRVSFSYPSQYSNPSQCALSDSVSRRSRRPTRISTRARFPVRGRPLSPTLRVRRPSLRRGGPSYASTTPGSAASAAAPPPPPPRPRPRPGARRPARRGT